MKNEHLQTTCADCGYSNIVLNEVKEHLVTELCPKCGSATGWKADADLYALVGMKCVNGCGVMFQTRVKVGEVPTDVCCPVPTCQAEGAIQHEGVDPTLGLARLEKDRWVADFKAMRAGIVAPKKYVFE